ncbi:MAG: 4-hydroxythreonine-4-phosphate dehydrogenase PdxA [Caldilineaceae bacterium]|nr:4-hydroxythreonine-4-phosphate dehydrogenase PdxA [Caldilineaceae bacterium]
MTPSSDSPTRSARLALLLGDPSGIGPEIVARILAEESDPDKTTASFNGVNIIVIGESWILEWGAHCAGLSLELPQYNSPEDLPPSPSGSVLLTGPSFPQEEHTPGQVSPTAGRYVLQTLDYAADLARAGLIDGITYASLNKQAMHAAGSRHEDELRYFADRLGVSGHVGEVNTLDGLYTSRVTSHIPLRAVYEHISVAEILPAIRLIHHTIRRSGLPSPRLAVAGLNPHAGEGGLFGSEEIDVIRPAVEAAQEEDIAASGPYPPDTVFLRASRGEFDGVVTMYHDQGQIAMKLLGFERGVTIHAGLTTPITTPAHGSAFDIVGKGVASPQALKQALKLCAQMLTPGAYNPDVQRKI